MTSWITSTLVLRTLSLARLYTGYLLVTSPSTLLSQNIVLTLSSAMRVPLPTVSSHTSVTAFPSMSTPASSLAALALAVLSISDLTTTTLPDSSYDDYWASQSISRTILFFGLAAWIYLTSDSGDPRFGRSDLDGMRNGLVFSWAFVEMTVMGWVLLCLRGEREERAKRIIKESEERRLAREREGLIITEK